MPDSTPSTPPQHTITRPTLGTAWPLTVPHGTLTLHPPACATFTAPDGTEYALNGAAQHAGYPPIDPIWADHPDIPTMDDGTHAKRDLGPLIRQTLALT